MKYYKHMSNMSTDPRIKRVRRKFGLEGYGLYCLVLEHISAQLDAKSPIPDLQETAEDIADEWGVDVRKVNEMTAFMVNEQLLDVDVVTGRLVCGKIEKYLDEYLRKAPEFKAALEAWKTKQIEGFGAKSDNIRQTPESVGQTQERVVECPSRIEENRREENSTERERAPEKRDGKVKHPRLACPMTQGWYDRIVSEWGEAIADRYIERVMAWDSGGGHGTKDFAARAHTFISRDVDAGKLAKREVAERPKTLKEQAREAFGKEYEGE